jgi:hypothetical protein
MLESLGERVNLVFRIVFGILEALYEIVNFIYSFTKGRTQRRV